MDSWIAYHKCTQDVSAVSLLQHRRNHEVYRSAVIQSLPILQMSGAPLSTNDIFRLVTLASFRLSGKRTNPHLIRDMVGFCRLSSQMHARWGGVDRCSLKCVCVIDMGKEPWSKLSGWLYADCDPLARHGCIREADGGALNLHGTFSGDAEGII